jgi:hypothetical protein
VPIAAASSSPTSPATRTTSSRARSSTPKTWSPEITRDVVEHLEPVLRVNKLEGDAAFGYALDGELDASMLLDSIEECYFGFRQRLRGIEHSTNCSCNACAKAPDLNLKFVVHYGDFIRRPGARGEELTGQASSLSTGYSRTQPPMCSDSGVTPCVPRRV